MSWVFFLLSKKWMKISKRNRQPIVVVVV